MNARRAPVMLGIFLPLLVAFGIWFGDSNADSLQDAASVKSGGPVLNHADSSTQAAISLKTRSNAVRRKDSRQEFEPSESAEQTPNDEDLDQGLEEALDEDLAILQLDNRPEQAFWRATHRTERRDPEWTARVKEELNQKAAKRLPGEADVQELDCRETVCRMFITFDDDDQAEAFRQAPNASSDEYEYQDMNPERKGTHEWGVTYEVLVKRDRSAGPSLDTAPAGPSEPHEDPGVPSAVVDDTAVTAQSSDNP